MPPITHSLTSVREWHRPHNHDEVFFSTKLKEPAAQRILTWASTKIAPIERLTFIAPARCMMPPADCVVATTHRLIVGSSNAGPSAPAPAMFPLDKVILRKSRKFNLWTLAESTLEIDHGGKTTFVTHVPPQDYGYFQEAGARARAIAEVASPGVFDRLAQAREVQYSSPDLHPAHEPAPKSAHSSDMGTAIAQLKEIGELRDAGVLSQSEFEQAKAKLGFTS